jgi:hypothetical protein
MPFEKLAIVGPRRPSFLPRWQQRLEALPLLVHKIGRSHKRERTATLRFLKWRVVNYPSASRPYASPSYEHRSMPQFGDAVLYVTGLTSLTKTRAGDVRGFLQRV